MSYNVPKMFRVISWGVLVTALYFIYQAVEKNWAVINVWPDRLLLQYVFAGVLLLQAYWFYQIMIWRWVMKVYGEYISFQDACILFFTNCLLAYVPGKVVAFVGVAVIAERKGVSSQRAVTAVLLFQIYAMISGATFIALASQGITLGGEFDVAIEKFWLVGVISFVGLILLSPRFQRNTISMLRRILKKDLEMQIPGYPLLLTQVTLYAVGWILPCLSIWFFFLATASQPELVPFFLVATVFVGSYLAGLISFFAPAGIGILEGGLLLGLGAVIEPSTILWGAAIFRIAVIMTSAISLILLSRRGLWPN